MPEHPAALSAASSSGEDAARQASLARAGRLAVLRRLAPALRHDLVVHLQSLGMMAEALGARLERGAVPAEDVQGAVAKLSRLSRQAVDAALQVSTWMQPAEDNTVPLGEGVEECINLLASNLNFRGYTLRQEGGPSDLTVSRSALRFLLCAGLLTVADRAQPPGDVVVRIESTGTEALLAIGYERNPERDAPWLSETRQEPLAWPEIQALAAEEQAELAPRGEALVVRLRRALVTSPLKMAPV